MVVHLSSKLSHLAQSFRPQHHLHSLRSAAHTTHTPGFFDPANVFIHNAPTTAAPPNAVAERNSTASSSAGAGNGGASAGGAGENKWHAGSRAPNWAFQTTRLSSQAPVSVDVNSRLSQEDEDEVATRPTHGAARPSRPQSLLTRSTSSTVDRPLLTPSEAGLSSTAAVSEASSKEVSSLLLSREEVHKRYRSAFGARLSSSAVEQDVGAPEADEVDLSLPQSVTPRRRASLGPSSTRPLLIGTLGRTSTTSGHATLSARAASTIAVSPSSSSKRISTGSTFPTGAVPPRASIPLARRNSTSSTSAARAQLPSSAVDPLSFPRGQTRPSSEARPPSTAPEDLRARPLGNRRPDQRDNVQHKRGHRLPGTGSTGARQEFISDEAKMRHVAIANARRAGHSAVEGAVTHYTSIKDAYSNQTHNLAMESLRITRPPGAPIRRIVELYADMFNHDNLRPTRHTYEIILKALCERDIEVQRDIAFLGRRILKKKLAAAARGPWNSKNDDGTFLLKSEKDQLARLEKEDYLTPAVEIYKSIGNVADQLNSSAVSFLIKAAAARKRIDLALSIFGRLERSPYQSVPPSVYHNLVKMYGDEKDASAIMKVFEAYLKARTSGLHVVENAAPDRPVYRLSAQKHQHSSSPEYVEVDAALGDSFSRGDAGFWRATIGSLFAAGDAAQAVTVFQRMLDAIEKAAAGTSPIPAGYPRALEADILSSVVEGFISVGDAESAKTWFDRGVAMFTIDASKPPAMFFTKPFYAAIESPYTDLLNHIYRAMLARADRSVKLTIPDFMAVLDYNLAKSYAADVSDTERDASLDAVVELRSAFEDAVRKGLVEGAPKDFVLSTGALSRIAIAFGTHGRFDDAAAAYVDFAEACGRASRFASEIKNKELKRSAAKWVLVASDTPVAGALGLRPPSAAEGEYINLEAAAYPEGTARPPIKAVATIVSALNKLRQSREWFGVPAYEVAVVESYLQSKAQAPNGDVSKLGLSGNLWYTVIEAFASVQAQIARGLVPSFDFPGFEPIIDDFAASGAKIPSHETTYNYTVLVKMLKTGGMSRERTMAVLAVLDQHLAETVDLGAAVDAATAEAPVENKATAPSAEEVAAATSSSEDATSASSPHAATSATSFPTPPSTPPTYFAELPPAPSVNAPAIDTALSQHLDSLVFSAEADAAVALALESAQQGRHAHPETLGRLIEVLGREGKADMAKQIYLMAYSILPALASDPQAQSTAWVTLEDHMIIALAQSGQLAEVGYHRDRLLQAGTAPSADGYAAMILNMKETTDDAAVALMLFEESQRFGVTPNVYLFNTLISKLSRARRAKEALEYFELMKTHGLQPSSITYGAVINACCKTGDDLSADYLFQEMTASPKFKPRVPPYNTMMQFYTTTKPDRQRVLHYYDALVYARVPPTGHTYKLLLDAFGSIGEPDLKSMEDVFTTLVNDRSVTVTGAHWASLINAYGSVAKNLDRAISVFESIEQHPSTVKSKSKLPDAVVYEALLNALIANDRADLCDKYLKLMDERGVRMTAYVANTLINGHANQKNMEAARAVFESLADPPSGVAAAGNHTVDRHPKHHHQANNALPASGPVYREPSTWETMIKAELAAGESEKAVALMRRVEQRAFPEAVVNRIRKQLSSVGLEAVQSTAPAS